MAKKKAKRPTKQKPKLQTPVHEPVSDDEKKASDETGLSIRALRLCLAGGLDNAFYEMYHQPVTSLAAVAKHFDVSERTAASWKSRGMPCEGKKYYLPVIRYWRLQQNDPPEWLITGNQNLPATEATGDLARAILRWM